MFVLACVEDNRTEISDDRDLESILTDLMCVCFASESLCWMRGNLLVILCLFPTRYILDFVLPGRFLRRLTSTESTSQVALLSSSWLGLANGRPKKEF